MLENIIDSLTREQLTLEPSQVAELFESKTPIMESEFFEDLWDWIIFEQLEDYEVSDEEMIEGMQQLLQRFKEVNNDIPVWITVHSNYDCTTWYQGDDSYIEDDEYVKELLSKIANSKNIVSEVAHAQHLVFLWSINLEYWDPGKSPKKILVQSWNKVMFYSSRHWSWTFSDAWIQEDIELDMSKEMWPWSGPKYLAHAMYFEWHDTYSPGQTYGDLDIYFDWKPFTPIY